MIFLVPMLSKEEKEKLNKRGPLMKQAYRMLKQCMLDIISGECNEDEVAEMMARVHPKENGYICPDDYWNVDECCRYLNMDRAQFYQKVVRKDRLEPCTFKNRNLGYKRSDIERYLHKHRDKENHRRMMKVNREKRKANAVDK